jgi:hypothetical protein
MPTQHELACRLSRRLRAIGSAIEAIDLSRPVSRFPSELVRLKREEAELVEELHRVREAGEPLNITP